FELRFLKQRPHQKVPVSDTFYDYSYFGFLFLSSSRIKRPLRVISVSGHWRTSLAFGSRMAEFSCLSATDQLHQDILFVSKNAHQVLVSSTAMNPSPL
ncbi:MAG: hypothetical protein ACJART_002252, partial [Maribacter sp.]